MNDAIPNHFSLLGLPARFALDEQALDRAHKRVQAQVHPDRYAAGTAAERRIAMQWAARANDAFETLRSPLRRAAYLCESHGVPIDAESSTAMPGGFLQQQMNWREERDDARAAADTAALTALAAQARQRHAAIVAQLGDVLDERRDFCGAAPLVRELMFVERFLEELAADAGRAEHGAEH